MLKTIRPIKLNKVVWIDSKATTKITQAEQAKQLHRAHMYISPECLMQPPSQTTILQLINNDLNLVYFDEVHLFVIVWFDVSKIVLQTEGYIF